MYQCGNAGASEASGCDHERLDAVFIFLAVLSVDMFIL